jgi:hypothetical protein
VRPEPSRPSRITAGTGSALQASRRIRARRARAAAYSAPPRLGPSRSTVTPGGSRCSGTVEPVSSAVASGVAPKPTASHDARVASSWKVITPASTSGERSPNASRRTTASRVVAREQSHGEILRRPAAGQVVGQQAERSRSRGGPARARGHEVAFVGDGARPGRHPRGMSEEMAGERAARTAASTRWPADAPARRALAHMPAQLSSGDAARAGARLRASTARPARRRELERCRTRCR